MGGDGEGDAGPAGLRGRMLRVGGQVPDEDDFVHAAHGSGVKVEKERRERLAYSRCNLTSLAKTIVADRVPPRADWVEVVLCGFGDQSKKKRREDCGYGASGDLLPISSLPPRCSIQRVLSWRWRVRKRSCVRSRGNNRRHLRNEGDHRACEGRNYRSDVTNVVGADEPLVRCVASQVCTFDSHALAGSQNRSANRAAVA
jgi:hypothetical protein